MTHEKFVLTRLHLIGFATVFFHAGIGAVITLWGLQLLAFLCDLSFEWQPVLQHLFLSLSLLALFPGQQYWTVQVTGPDGRLRTIVGREPETY